MDDSSPSREQRPAHRPPEPPASAPPLQPGGAAFDNHAYQHDTPAEDEHARQNDDNHNVTASESFGVNGSTNGTRPYDKEPYEAVNLELINLAPKNGQHVQNGQAKDIPHKKDVEVDIPSSHYDEYFVPVNEHKKSLRGEKLYVMADKRGKGGCRKRLCWTLGVLLLLGAILIAVLAATGVFSNSNTATPVDQYNSSISSARAFGGISAGFEHTEHKENGNEEHNDQTHSDHDHDHDHDHSGHNHNHIGHEEHVEHDDSNAENDRDNVDLDFAHTEDSLKEPTPEPIKKDHDTTTQTPAQTEIVYRQELGKDSQREHVHTTIVDQSGISVHSVTTHDDDDSMYVPRTVEGVLKIDNEQLQPEMLDESSSTYRQLSSTLTSAIARALLVLDDQRTDTDHHLTIQIVGLRPGSLIVTYRIHWTPKNANMRVPDPITPDILKSRLSNYLERNGRMLNVYHVSEDQLEASRVLDLCQDESNGCEYGCEFDKVLLDFKCTCPEDKVPDMNNPKTCVHPLDNSLYQPIEQAKSDNEEFKILNVSDESEHTRYIRPEEPITFDWMGDEISTSEAITERSSDIEQSHIFGIPNDKDKMHVQSNPEPRPEPSASTPEPQSVEEFADITTEFLQKNDTEYYNNIFKKDSETHLLEPTGEPISEPAVEQEPTFETNTEDKVTTQHAMLPEPSSKQATEQSVSIITEPFNTETFWPGRPTWMIEMQKESALEPTSEEPESRLQEPKSTPEISEPQPEPASKSFVLKSETEYTDAPISESQEPTNETPFEASGRKTNIIPELNSSEGITTESNLQLKPKPESGMQQEFNSEVTTKSEEMSDPEQAPHPKGDEAIDDKVIALAKSVYQLNDTEKTLNTSTESKDASDEYNSNSQDIPDSDTIHSSKEINDSPKYSENSEHNSSKDSQREIMFFAAERNQFDKEITERTTENGLANTRNTSREESELEDVSSKEENNQRFDEGRNLKYAQNKEVALSGTEDSSSYINSDETTTIIEGLVDNTNTTKFEERGSADFVFTLNDLKEVTELAIGGNEQKNKDQSQSEENYSSSSKEISMNVNKKPENTNNEISTATEIIDAVTKAFVATGSKSEFLNVESSSDSDIYVTSVTESVIHNIVDNETMESSRSDADWLISGKDDEADTDDSTTDSSTIDVNEHEQSMDNLDADYIINSSDKEKNEMTLYGILTDYDVANNRGKRIENSNSTEKITIATTEQISPTEKMIADYIYNNSHIRVNNGQKEGQDKIETSKEEPAPVWEHTEIEPEKVFYNEEVSNEFTTEIQTMNSQPTTTPPTSLESTLSKDKSNRNVTVYEVPANYTKLSKGEYTGDRKSEPEEHDSEMNPFLPEIENNKSLVKKLHEGHDIELSNINDTQNEPSLEEIQSKEHKTVNATIDLSTQSSESSVSEENTQGGPKSLMKIENTNSDNENNKNNNGIMNNNGTAAVALTILTRDKSFKPPISSFLDDVSDLVPSKGWTTTEDTINQHLGSDNEMTVSTILRANPLNVNSASLRTVSSIHDVFEMELKTNAPTIDQSFSEETESNDPLSVISIKSAKKLDKKPANDFRQKKNEKSAKLQENKFNDISDDSENSRTLSRYNPSSNSEQQ